MATKIKLAIVGSRSFTDYNFLKNKINSILKKYDLEVTHIVSGGARGVDKMGERYADEYELEKIIHYADWDRYKKSAGHIRNEYIARDCDVMIAFWDGISTGTADARNWQENIFKKDLITVYV
jgi:hypothetical protein